MRVPADWTVRRVTDGPGSARVEITAPDDPGAALYLTQSPVPDPDPAVTATALRVGRINAVQKNVLIIAFRCGYDQGVSIHNRLHNTMNFIAMLGIRRN
mgnify:CR=1 FL=1